MKVYFIRHGESVLNATKTHQFSDTPLSSHGEQQAQFVAKRFLSLPIEKIFTSDYLRAKQTAETIAQTINKPLEFSELIRERKRPSELFGKSYDDEEGNKIKELVRKNADDKNWHYSDEENFYDILQRASEFVKLLEAEEKTGTEHVVVVSHGTILRTIILSMMFKGNVSSNVFQTFRDFMILKNTGITICEYENDHWKLLTWNDHAHLGE